MLRRKRLNNPRHSILRILLHEGQSMISFQRIAKYIGAEPFRPFRITTASGRTFEIRHPEMIHLGRSTMIIFTHLSDNPEEVKEQQVEVSLLLTECVEPLDSTVHPKGAA
jgi:hypothetical protein